MAFNIGKYAETAQKLAPTERDVETITAEYNQHKKNGGKSILGMGNCLIELKAKLSHGEWLVWLQERGDCTERAAQRLMRLAREFSNPTALSDLGATKAMMLLALPPEERETFMEENNLVDMTSRELQKAIKERDEARRAAEAASADARSAEESRAKMEEDMAVLKQLHESAQENEAQAREALAEAQAELKELRDRPVDVAVEVDREAVEKARAEAVAEMTAKVDAAERARKEAEEKRKAAEKALADAKKQAGSNAAILSRAEKAEAELAEARRRLEEAAKSSAKSAISSDADLATFQLCFDQTQIELNRMGGILLKYRNKEDTETFAKLSKAYLALLDNARRHAE